MSISPPYTINPSYHINNSSIIFENTSGSTIGIIIVASICGSLAICVMCLYYLCSRKQKKNKRWIRQNQVVDITHELPDLEPTPTVLRDQFYDNNIYGDNQDFIMQLQPLPPAQPVLPVVNAVTIISITKKDTELENSIVIPIEED